MFRDCRFIKERGWIVSLDIPEKMCDQARGTSCQIMFRWMTWVISNIYRREFNLEQTAEKRAFKLICGHDIRDYLQTP